MTVHICWEHHIKTDTAETAGIQNAVTLMTFLFSSDHYYYLLYITVTMLLNTIKVYLFWIDLAGICNVKANLFFSFSLDWHGCTLNFNGLYFLRNWNFRVVSFVCISLPLDALRKSGNVPLTLVFEQFWTLQADFWICVIIFPFMLHYKLLLCIVCIPSPTSTSHKGNG